MEKNPNDYFCDLLRELLDEAGLRDGEIHDAHVRRYEDGAPDVATINRFRNGKTPNPGASPRIRLQEAVAAATSRDLPDLWAEASRRFLQAVE